MKTSKSKINTELMEFYDNSDLDGFVELLRDDDVNPDTRSLDGRTCLEQLCEREQSADFVRALLKAGANPNQGNTHPLISSCRAEQFEVVQALLEHNGTDVNAAAPNKSSVLIFLSGVNCKQNQLKTVLACISLLFGKKDLDANKPDEYGSTAIMYAVQNHHEERVHRMLVQKNHLLNIDVLIPVYGGTVRDMILEMFPHFNYIISPPIMESLEAQNPQDRLLAALQHRNIEIFRAILKEKSSDNRPVVNPNHIYGNPYHCPCIEVACKLPDSEEFVECLLNAGATPVLYTTLHRIPLIHFVVASCNYATLKLLIRDGRINIGEQDSQLHNALHVAANRRFTTEEDKYRLVQCTWKLLASSSLDINCQDEFGDTPLHDASRFGCDQITLPLLRHGASIMAVNQDGLTPLAYLTPDVFETFLNEHVSNNRYASESDQYRILFDYSFMDPCNVGKDTFEMDPLLVMTKPHLRHLLQHPVIDSFIQLKWKHIQTPFFINIAFYALFITFLSSYIFLMRFYTELGDDKESDNDVLSKLNDTSSESMRCSWHRISYFVYTFWILYIIFLISLVFREVIQLWLLKCQYVKQTRNWLDIIVIALSVYIVQSCCLDAAWDIHLATLAILLGWTEFVLLTGSLPVFSLQLMMLRSVAFTFVRFMAWYSLVILPFALCFYLLFWSVSYTTVLRPLAMFTGELEAADLPFHLVPVTSHLVFLLFVLLVAVVLLNLLNGLAVSDTQAIQSNAALHSLVWLVHLVSRIDHFVDALLASPIIPERYRQHLRDNIRLFSTVLKNPRIQVIPRKNGKVVFYCNSRCSEISNNFYNLDKNVINAAIELFQSNKKFKQVDFKQQSVDIVKGFSHN